MISLKDVGDKLSHSLATGPTAINEVKRLWCFTVMHPEITVYFSLRVNCIEVGKYSTLEQAIEEYNKL